MDEGVDKSMKADIEENADKDENEESLSIGLNNLDASVQGKSRQDGVLHDANNKEEAVDTQERRSGNGIPSAQVRDKSNKDEKINHNNDTPGASRPEMVSGLDNSEEESFNESNDDITVQSKNSAGNLQQKSQRNILLQSNDQESVDVSWRYRIR